MFTSTTVEGKRSENNPFRTPSNLTPNPTGASTSQSAMLTTRASDIGSGSTSNGDGQSRVDDAPSYVVGDRGAEDTSSSTRSNNDTSIAGLAEELQRSNLDSDTTPTPSEPPPAYSPSADFFQGEATVQYGPRRPFQQAPPAPPLPPHLSPQGTGASRFSGGFQSSPLSTAPMLFVDPTGSGFGPSSGWGAGPFPPQQTGGSSFSSSRYRPPPGPPPRHPTSASVGSGSRISSAPAPPPRPLSDFARDFYSSQEANEERALSSDDDDTNEGPEPPTRNHVPAPSTSSSSPSRLSSTSTGALNYAPPPGPPPPPGQYAPPSGPPPASATRYAPPAGPPPTRPSGDDGKPTASPTPGRPYLNKGRVLVYPAGHECRKCLNTGYKHFDPSHPCRKCWERFGKPYAGAIVTAPWDAPSSSASRLQYQRPLPTFRPPQLRHRHSRSQPSLFASSSDNLSPPNLLRSSRSSFHGGDYPGASAQAQQQQLRPGAFNLTRGPPPLGATVVRPGDPRIGGRPCWRCGGDGTVSFLIFDIETCPTCRGVGRVF